MLHWMFNSFPRSFFWEILSLLKSGRILFIMLATDQENARKHTTITHNSLTILKNHQPPQSSCHPIKKTVCRARNFRYQRSQHDCLWGLWGMDLPWSVWIKQTKGLSYQCNVTLSSSWVKSTDLQKSNSLPPWSAGWRDWCPISRWSKVVQGSNS